MEKKIFSEELEEISRWFLSSNEERKEGPTKSLPESVEGQTHQMDGQTHQADGQTHQTGEEFEIDETIRVQRRISFSNTQNAQNEMKACLLKHLQENYTILRVELMKTTDQLQPKAKKSVKEEVLICVKESS